MFVFPTTDKTKVIHKEVYNDVEFTICEVLKPYHHLLNDKRYRFFVIVDEQIGHIHGLSSAIEIYEEMGRLSWSWFCHTKQDCKDYISDFVDAHESILRLVKRRNKSPRFHLTATQQIQSISMNCITKFGIAPTPY